MSEETPLDEGFTATEPGFGADASSEPADKPAEADAKTGEEEPAKESEGESPPPVEEDDDKPTDAFQKRIDKLTSSFRESERLLDAKTLEYQELQKQLADVPEVIEPSKSLADFDYDEGKYREYLFDESARRGEKAAERVVNRARATERADTVADEFANREKAFEKDVADYKEVTRSRDLKISNTMKAELEVSDVGPDMAYYLGKNPDEASRLDKMPSREVIREMQTLETSIRAEKAKAAKKVSDAPKPPAKIAGKSAPLKTATTDPASDKMTDAQWFAAEDKRNAKLRG